MRLYAPLVTITGLLLAGCATTGYPSQSGVIAAKNKVAPALVHVRPVKEVFTRGTRQEVSVQGSGFILTQDGYVVTNEHVAGQSRYVRCVLFDKTEVDAEVVGVDSFTDIAVLRLVTDRTNLPTVKLGDSSKIEAGEFVLALGSPHGLSRSVSAGIISVTDRNLEDLGGSNSPYNNWIQTDAAINPGNSGGPLVNLRGEVIGINTRKLSGADNVGFAIPIDVARDVVEEIIAYGKVQRSTLGFALQGLSELTNDPRTPGVLIGDVSPVSPASDAGLEPGDVLIAVNGVPTNGYFTEELPALRKMIADLPVGETVSLSLVRGDESMTVNAETVDLGEREGEQNEFSVWGFSVAQVTRNVARIAQLGSERGVLIIGVQSGSPAGVQELNRGDIILEVDEIPVENLAQFSELYTERTTPKKEWVLLRIKRGPLTMYKLLRVRATAEDAA